MRTKIAAWLMSMALTINGGPIDIEEAEPMNTVPETVITETILTENTIPETVIEEVIVPEEHEGEIFEVEGSNESWIKEKLTSAKETISEAVTSVCDKVFTRGDKIETMVIFRDPNM